jgi:hypothetical protein
VGETNVTGGDREDEHVAVGGDVKKLIGTVLRAQKNATFHLRLISKLTDSETEKNVDPV